MRSSLLFFFLLVLSAMADLKTGDMTYYTEWSHNYGSCGLDRSLRDHNYVAALSRHYMQLPPGLSNPNNHPLCASNHCIEVQGSRGTKKLKISDTCWGCARDDIDVAHTMFPLIEDPSRGRVKVNWRFVNC